MSKGKIPIKKFKKEPKFMHNRSEGMTWRRNGGSSLQTGRKKEQK